MTIHGIGTDIIECLRIAKMIERHGELFLTRVYTPHEIEYCTARKLATLDQHRKRKLHISLHQILNSLSLKRPQPIEKAQHLKKIDLCNTFLIKINDLAFTQAN